MLNKTLEEVRQHFQDDIINIAKIGDHPLPRGVRWTRDLPFALVKSGMDLPKEFDWEDGDCELGSVQAEVTSADRWTQNIENLMPSCLDGASWDWDEMGDFSQLAGELHRELLEIPINILGANVDLVGVDDIGCTILSAAIVADMIGEPNPFINKVKEIWSARAFPMGMSGFVPDTWPEGESIVYWPYEDPPQIAAN